MGGELRVFAYCTEPAREAVAVAMGVEPVTSPPLASDGLGGWWQVDGKPVDFCYFRLHGHPMYPEAWFGESEDDALPSLAYVAFTAENLVDADLADAVVVLANCYGATSPLVQGFYEAGARAVIAGSGPNLAAGNMVVGTDLLARTLLRMLEMFPEVDVAKLLHMARARLLLTAWRESERDTLEFHVVEKVAG